MQAAPIPVDELLRLETLRSLKILDTEPEERFDRITRLARKLFATPIALVSLVDSDRQWFKSEQGLSVAETPRDVSFCAHAIIRDEILVISDTQADERFRDNPLVTNSPSIRFYAGYPLSAPDGKKIGTLCVIDRVPRQFDVEDRETLQDLGEMVEEELVVADMVRNDPVTGLSNRSGFLVIAERLLAVCSRTKAPASLMLIEVTNYFMTDRALGAAEHDRTAIELTQLLMATVRDSDFLGRIEPNRFAALLVGSQVDDVAKIRERLMERLQIRNLHGESAYEITMPKIALPVAPKRILHPDRFHRRSSFQRRFGLKPV
jgi:diguanylate cyclase (GGDEF)-like protein